MKKYIISNNNSVILETTDVKEVNYIIKTAKQDLIIKIVKVM